MKDLVIGSNELRRLLQGDGLKSNVGQKFSGVMAWRINLHEDFFDWLSRSGSDSDGDYRKRCSYIITRLRVDGYMSRHKPVKGKAEGWWRARCGGTSGSQYYMWYTNGTTDIGKSLGLGEREVLVREFRHHDIIEDPPTSSSRSDWIEFDPEDFEISEDVRPYTSEQYRVALDQSCPISIIKGYPGSGKTTALQLAVTKSNTERVLYLTFSQRLAVEASRYFNAYQKEGQSIDVMSFAELINLVSDSPTSSVGFPSVYLLADLLKKLIRPQVAKQFGAWTNHHDELYAELHAHAIGRSLPISFRGYEASDGTVLDPKVYEEMRASEGLGEASKDAAEILKLISEPSMLSQLFPSAFSAREAISEIYKPLPSRFTKIGMVLIDEVQDLTPIEYFFVLNVISRIAVGNKEWPKLLIAGDESQTVRPTEFEWAWMKEMTATVFEGVSFHEEILSSNLRSPLSIAEFVEATRAQYSLLPRVERPSGLTATDTNEQEIGKVIYCLMKPNESINDLLDITESLPRSVVIYPGFRLPKELYDKEDEERIWTSLEAKGLDFENVFVLDAGKNQETFRKKLSDIKHSDFLNVWARSSADNFRVACSRSTKNLVLIDRDGVDKSDYIRELFTRKNVEIFEEWDLVDVSRDLEDDESTSLLEKLERVLDDVDTLVETNTERALKRARTASRQLEILNTEQIVPAELAERVNISHGSVAEYWVANPIAESDLNFKAIQAEAYDYFNKTDISSAYNAYKELQVQLKSKTVKSWTYQKKTLDLISAALVYQDLLTSKATVIARNNENLILKGVEHLHSVEIDQIEESDQLMCLQVYESVVDKFGKRHPYLIEQAEVVITSWVTDLRSQLYVSEALSLIHASSTPLPQLKGLCLEDLGVLSEAIEIFEFGGFTLDAIRCARKLGDFDKARELNNGRDAELDSYLNWIQSTIYSLKSGSGTSIKPLAEEEELLRGFDMRFDLNEFDAVDEEAIGEETAFEYDDEQPI